MQLCSKTTSNVYVSFHSKTLFLKEQIHVHQRYPITQNNTQWKRIEICWNLYILDSNSQELYSFKFEREGALSRRTKMFRILTSKFVEIYKFHIVISKNWIVLNLVGEDAFSSQTTRFRILTSLFLVKCLLLNRFYRTIAHKRTLKIAFICFLVFCIDFCKPYMH